MDEEAVKHIRMGAYNYTLPDERIAKYPLTERDQAKLLIRNQAGAISEDTFANLPAYLPPESLLVFNNTKVIQARLHFRKESGALIEILCLEPVAPADYALNFQQTAHVGWLCMIGNLKKWKEGTLRRELTVKGLPVTLTAARGDLHGAGYRVDFGWDNPALTFSDILEAFGELPIPPYLNRDAEESDKADYQTVYSKVEGSVAAPTAGLHFTPALLEQLRGQGVSMQELTLHVGAGTFKPVKSEEIGAHDMHTEHFSVTLETVEALAAGKRIIAVGTTSVRTLESLSVLARRAVSALKEHRAMDVRVEQWDAYREYDGTVCTRDALRELGAYMTLHHMEVLHASTRLIIAPGYSYRLVDGMITNFHQPGSTLLLLVAAFMQHKEEWRKVYEYALAHDFRFLSYGDGSLLLNV
ncbi:MAG: S-adenosylmethionine:tRNA ribosyltransferase-isomerase [Prevotellaceae bacterium]|nr:S-adenosylmethionine:tRNA ribosyltransferase-isomerase [Prevotellaceae bacterium]